MSSGTFQLFRCRIALTPPPHPRRKGIGAGESASGGGGGVALGGADGAGGEGGGSSSSTSRMTPDRSICSICIVARGPAVEFRRGGHCPLSAKVREFVQVLHITTDRDGLLEETLRALPVVALEH